MTRKHFIEFANMLASHEGQTCDQPFDPTSPEGVAFDRGYQAARQDIGRSIAAICRVHNENFDAVKFYDAAKLVS